MMHYEAQLINLLLVESEQGVRDTFHRYLDETNLNLSVTEVCSGEQVIELFKDKQFDCILLDNELEDMNGQMVLSFLQDGPTLSVPVIVFSGKQDIGLDLELLESGAVEFIPKHLCNGLLLRRAILYSLVRRQYIKSQREYIDSQKELLEQQSWYEEESKIEMLKNEKEHAEAANRAKSKFLSNMSHELRTPLNAILGFAQLLMFKSKNPLSDHQQDNVREIIKAGNHLLSLINDVLDLSKIEAGKIDIRNEQVNVSTVLKECVKLTTELALLRCCHVSFECDETLKVKVDYIRFKQVLLNLLTNAIKYNRQQGTVEISCNEVDERFLQIDVKDSGIGIAKELFDQVFKPFSRLTAVNTAIEGTGIGLTLSQRLVHEMNGEIGFDSELGVGSRFWVKVPLVVTSSITKGLPSRGRRLLYIDGNMDNILELKTQWQQQSKIDLLTCDTLDVALKLVRRKVPQLVIIDMEKLYLPAPEVIERIRNLEALESVQVIALTADTHPGTISDGLKAGFDQVLMKPLEMKQIVELAISTIVGLGS